MIRLPYRFTGIRSGELGESERELKDRVKVGTMSLVPLQII